MTLVRIHHDGWLALPSVQRRRLGLRTGDMLEAVLPRALKARGKRPGARTNAAPPGRG